MQVERMTQVPDPSAVEALARRADEADGIKPLSEQVMLHVAGGEAPGVTHLLVRDGAKVVAYAHLERAATDDPAGVEILVDPGHREQGWGTRLLNEARRVNGGPVRVWAHGYLDSARRFADEQDMRVVRELWQMARPLSRADAVPPVLPEGFRLRTFTPDDIPAWLEVNTAAFATHPEQGRITRADVEQRMAQPWFDPAGLLLVEDVREGSPRLAAYHWTKVEGGVGEVYVVGVDPAYQGHGLGKTVTLAGLAHLASIGMPAVTLYVDGDNHAALATYRALGFSRTTLDVMLAPR